MHLGGIQYTAVFGSSMVNDLRFTHTYEDRPRTSNSAIPQVVVGTAATYGRRDFLPTTQDDKRTQITDAFSLTKGSHNIKVGVDYSRLNVSQLFAQSQSGDFRFTSSVTDTLLEFLTVGGPTANRFDTPDARYRLQIGTGEAAFGIKQLAFFGQDSWRVSRSLTLDLGLRWEGQWNPQPEATNATVIQRATSVALPIGLPVTPTKIRNSLDQIMPRFGFALTPFSDKQRFVIRGHAGLFYAATPMLLFADATNNFRNPPGMCGWRSARRGGRCTRRSMRRE